MSEKQLVITVQDRLADLGYYALKSDGVWGIGTENALVAFKEFNGLRGRPYPGPITMQVLFSDDAKPAPALDDGAKLASPPWMIEARRLLGTREVPGPGNNPKIMGWAKDLDQWYPGDDTPWCGLFVAHCMAKGAPNEPQNFNRLGAREWLKYGKPVLNGVVPLGAIIVFWRTHKTDSWHGHVALATGVSSKAVRVIGGNQSDAVSETWFPKDRILGIRVPNGFVLENAPVAKTGEFSRSEA